MKDVVIVVIVIFMKNVFIDAQFFKNFNVFLHTHTHTASHTHSFIFTVCLSVFFVITVCLSVCLPHLRQFMIANSHKGRCFMKDVVIVVIVIFMKNVFIVAQFFKNFNVFLQATTQLTTS